MQQRGGMDEFDAGGEFDMPLPGIAAKPRGGEGKQRAQALAARGDEMRGQLRDQRHRALHPRHNCLVGGLHIGRQQRRQLSQSIVCHWRRTIQLRAP
jgi:hypothetical protein